jgi:mono/diheme cytochrome c family protein
MSRKAAVPIFVLAAMVAAIHQSAWAFTANELMAALKADAKQENAAFKEFSAARGESFFKTKHGNEWSCASCHTENPAVLGKHAKTSKDIQPLAPSANAERFTDEAKVAKWFKRNCKDVLDRVCTPQEKGDVLAYLMTVRK